MVSELRVQKLRRDVFNDLIGVIRHLVCPLVAASHGVENLSLIIKPSVEPVRINQA